MRPDAIDRRLRATSSPAAALRRVRGLIRKESLQIVRDPSSIALALVTPIVLLFLFGYAMRLDVEDVPLAVVLERPGPESHELAARFRLSRYFETALVMSMERAERMLLEGEVDAIVRVRGDFARDLLGREEAAVQAVVNGIDANRARLVLGYIGGTFERWRARQASDGGGAGTRSGAVSSGSGGGIRLEQRVWFNSELRSQNFLVPGLIALIMTLIGTLLTALVMARERERGTLEALLVSPVRVREILLSKVVPYFALGMGGMALSVILAVTLFDVPFRGSLWVLVGASSLFLLGALGLGLVISSLAPSQFVASQVSIVISFLPVFFFSGMLYDLLSTPAGIRWLSYLFGARYFVAIIQSVFLAGDVWPVILPNALALLVMALVFLAIARRRLRKRLQ